MAVFFMAVGILIMFSVGGCTLLFASYLTTLSGSFSSLIPVIGLILVVAGIPFFVGWVIFQSAKTLGKKKSNGDG